MTTQLALGISIGALAFALVAGCASSPPRASPTRPMISGNGTKPDPKGVDTLASTQPAAVDRSQADVDIAMRKQGYKPATFRGERVYCRNETLTGSNLESKVCLTAEQIESQERAGKDILNGNRAAGRPPGCVPSTGCN
jgi:hypothetical protein